MLSRRAPLIAAALGLIAALLSACGSSAGGSGSTAAGGYKIGVMVFDTQLPFAAPVLDALRAESKKSGVDIDIQSGQADPTREAQIMQQFTTQRKDLILAWPSDADAIVPSAKQAQSAGIPVVAMSSDFSDTSARKTYVGTNDVQFGEQIAAAAEEVGGSDAKIAVILGQLGSTPQRDRSEGIEKYIADHPGMTILAEQTADWDNAKALKVGQDLLNKYPRGSIDVIVGQGPETVSAARYAAKAGRTDVKFVVGDVSRDVAESLKGGIAAAAVWQDPYFLGERAIRTAVAILDKKEYADPDTAPTKVITSADADTIPSHSLF